MQAGSRSTSYERGARLLLLNRIALAAFALIIVHIVLLQFLHLVVLVPLLFLPRIFAKDWIDVAFENPPSNIEVLGHSFISSLTKRPSLKAKRPKIGCSLRIPIEPKKFQRYCELTGFTTATMQKPGLAALSYIHSLSITACGTIVSHPGFPFPAFGLIHIKNHVCLYKEVAFTPQGFDFVATTMTYTETAKGVEIFFVVECHDPDSGELVFKSVATLLYRIKTGIAAEPKKGPRERVVCDGEKTKEWKLASNLGWQYAQCSGDFNPIHVHPLLAKLFGQPTCIAHGMFTLARAIASLENTGLAGFDAAAPKFPIQVANEWKLPLRIPSKASVRYALGKKGDKQSCGIVPRSPHMQPCDDVDEFVSFLVEFSGGKPHNAGAVWVGSKFDVTQ